MLSGDLFLFIIANTEYSELLNFTIRKGFSVYKI